MEEIIFYMYFKKKNNIYLTDIFKCLILDLVDIKICYNDIELNGCAAFDDLIRYFNTYINRAIIFQVVFVDKNNKVVYFPFLIILFYEKGFLNLNNL